MDLLSLQYILFIGALLAAFYGLPAIRESLRRFQWILLLAASLLMYWQTGGIHILFILLTSCTIYVCGLLLSGVNTRMKGLRKDKALTKELKHLRRAELLRSKRLILTAGLGINFGILAYLKYWNALFPSGAGAGALILPFGISFYTFQSVSYLIDVYGGKYEAEQNYAHFLLFVSWFPQLLQGPIGRYDRLRDQLLGEHRPDREKAERALYLILFGLMKKYAIADMLSSPVSAILDGDLKTVPGSLVVFGILLYSAQQYADFSGGIDVIRGVSALFGIELDLNFRQPYFSVSLGDFWRRWHISLGAWMRDYLFYPFALIKPMQNFGKWCQKHFGRHFGRVLPAGIANILVFFVVGIWHGAQLHYIFWGLYNGIVIALSDLTSPFWKGFGKKLGVKESSRGFHVFRILRTFLIVNIGWYFDRIYTAANELQAFRATLFRFDAGRFAQAFHDTVITPGGGSFASLGGFVIAAAALVLLCLDSIIRERGGDPFILLQRRGVLLRPALCYAVILLIFSSFVFTASAGGFLYANF